MIDKVLDLFMNFMLNKWPYLLTIGFILFISRLLANTKRKSGSEYKRLEKIVLLSIGIPLFLIIFLVICTSLYYGVSDNIANNVETIMMIALGGMLFIIPLIFVIAKKRSRSKDRYL